MIIIAVFGVWLISIGTMIDRIPTGRELPIQFSLFTTTTTTATATTNSQQQQQHDYDFSQVPPQDDVVLTQIRTNNQRLLEVPDNDNTNSKSNDAKKKKSTVNVQTRHSHVIPNTLIFTHSINLLTYKPPSNTSNKIISKEQQVDMDELLALQANVYHTINLYPNANVRFLTDEDCIRSLQTVLGQKSPLITFFQKESEGMYKADICRGAALYETGGLYFDVDVGVRTNLFEKSQEEEEGKTNWILFPNTTFVTSLVHRQSNHIGNFFQAFMGTTSHHDIIKRYLKLFQQYYEGQLTRPIHKGPLGVILLRQAFDDIILLDNDVGGSKNKLQLGPKTIDTIQYGRIQLWQEILYDTKYFSNVLPAPTWGTRRACHFVVVANRHFPLQVPFYSRIEGSRMCRNSTSTKKEKAKDVHHHKKKEKQAKLSKDEMIVKTSYLGGIF